VHPSGLPPDASCSIAETIIDKKYGRMFTPDCLLQHAVYGYTARMKYYVDFPGLLLVDELRVPYRRIPIFAVDRLDVISDAVKRLTSENSGHTILLRGQGKTYLLERAQRESDLLYGQPVNEPSFLPSSLRLDFAEFTLQSIWHNQAAMLLNDIAFDLKSTLSPSDMDEFWKEIEWLQRSPQFDGFALGIAQHYGLPSVGLDVTDDVRVAAWFALYDVSMDASRMARSTLVSPDARPTVFVFRCPTDAVFDYRDVRPKHFPTGRPDRQSAWFAHVGWGSAANQMASYLMCGFRLSPDVAAQLPSDFCAHLFPKRDDDPILQFFLAMKNQAKYEGEAKRALQRIYYFT
jgi:hypothetical protein